MPSSENTEGRKTVSVVEPAASSAETVSTATINSIALAYIRDWKKSRRG
jgi:hypothetical protein